MNSSTSRSKSARVGYVVKRYPRYSETFIVNEILAHEKAGMDLHIFALRPPVDTHFQPGISRVRAAVTYLSDHGKMADFWKALIDLESELPGSISTLMLFRQEDIRTLYQAILLAKAVRQLGIQHLHAHFATASASVTRVAAALVQITYSITAHAKDIFHESVADSDLHMKLRDASTTITVSDYNVRYLQEKYAPDAERVVRVYNGLDLNLFSFKESQKRPAHILAVGRLVEKKGFGDLIRACAILVARGERFTCHIVGSGAMESTLQDLIVDNGLTNHVKMLGPRPQSDIITMLKEACIFAAPCVVGEDGNRDGLPTVLLEAMALGTPCISTDVTGIPEILHDEKTGLLVPQRDPSALADALIRLLNDSHLRTRLAHQARALIESQFDIEKNAARIREHFRIMQEEPPVRPVLKKIAANAL